jgi:hypothetical protein
MKTSKDKTTITISQVTNEFIWDMNIFEKKKIRRKYYENNLIEI